MGSGDLRCPCRRDTWQVSRVRVGGEVGKVPEGRAGLRPRDQSAMLFQRSRWGLLTWCKGI
jgi:hypothetical protein